MLSWACRQAEPRRRVPEHVPGAAQLAGLRPILGVVHHDEIAARELQRVVQGLGLGLRRLLRARRASGSCRAGPVRQHRRLGLGVDRLEHQQDLELGRRIVERAQRPDRGRAARWPRARAAPARCRPAAAGRGRAGHAGLSGRTWRGARQRLAQRDQPQQRHAQERAGRSAPSGRRASLRAARQSRRSGGPTSPGGDDHLPGRRPARRAELAGCSRSRPRTARSIRSRPHAPRAPHR